jgi:membrane protein YdbS with pleckstrin-like domain
MATNDDDNINSDMDSDEQSEILSRFPGQRDGEEVEFALRKHPITLLPAVLYILFIIILPIIFYVLIVPHALPALLEKPYQDIFFLLVTIYYGFLWIVISMEWSDYYLDFLLVTNKRIMKVEQLGLFHRIVSELELERIQDITSFVNGPIQTLFNFGDLEIQTASEENKIEPKAIPHPVTVRRKIMELCEAKDEK